MHRLHAALPDMRQRGRARALREEGRTLNRRGGDTGSGSKTTAKAEPLPRNGLGGQPQPRQEDGGAASGHLEAWGPNSQQSQGGGDEAQMSCGNRLPRKAAWCWRLLPGSEAHGPPHPEAVGVGGVNEAPGGCWLL